jgi:hydroxymethylglutaryl-CoA synthase
MTHADKPQVGLDALGIAVPSLTLELTKLAAARGIEPGKFLDGLGVTRMSIPPLDEDTVTLAARAGKQALEQGGIDPNDIGLLVVGTETAVDHSKPVASYVQGILGLPKGCRVFETKHACYGATAGLQNALDWIRAGSNDGKKALVIGADIARYGLKTPGEPTQGAGAVAMVLSESPRLIAFDHGLVGTYANDVLDFWRPLYSKDAVVDGHYSVGCYLDALEGAYRAYREKAERPGAAATAGGGEHAFFSDRFAAIAYHVPYGKMASKAHRHLRAVDGDGAATTYAEQVAPSLVYPRQVGNIYTGSLYLALASLLAEDPRDLAGQSIGLFSYGSGSCAEFWSGTVQLGAQARVRSSGWSQLIESQRRLEIPEYEEILNAREAIDNRPHTPHTDGNGAEARYLGVQEHRRMYSSPARSPG